MINPFIMDKSPTPSTSTAHVKRPLNPFMLWAKQERKKMCEGKTCVDHSKISSMLGKKWKTKLSEEERQQWKLKADLGVAKHKLDYPDYKYRPRHRNAKKTKKAKKESEDTSAPVLPASLATPATPVSLGSPATPVSLGSPATPVFPVTPPAPPVPPISPASLDSPASWSPPASPGSLDFSASSSPLALPASFEFPVSSAPPGSPVSATSPSRSPYRVIRTIYNDNPEMEGIDLDFFQTDTEPLYLELDEDELKFMRQLMCGELVMLE